ncbi:MAG: hypothetical protein SGILL_000510 [Bacillariaceae sp.]
MVEIEQLPAPDRGAEAARHGHNVVSGEESEDIFHEAQATDDDAEHDTEFQQRRRNLLGTLQEDSDDEEDQAYQHQLSSSHDYELYDKNLDDEDEAYVYKNLRGGVKESVRILREQQRRQQQQESETAVMNQSNPSHNQNKKNIQMYKPRGTDAVLSCPCCFNIVCMDCQRHSRYPNQFRAIFVMGITVDWHKILVYDPIHQVLVAKQDQEGVPRFQHSLPDAVPHHDHYEQVQERKEQDDSLAWLEEPIHSPSTVSIPKTKDGEYFAVECANCQTQVAALDMKEEVYHFHGCLESSPAV